MGTHGNSRSRLTQRVVVAAWTLCAWLTQRLEWAVIGVLFLLGLTISLTGAREVPLVKLQKIAIVQPYTWDRFEFEAAPHVWVRCRFVQTPTQFWECHEWNHPLSEER